MLSNAGEHRLVVTVEDGLRDGGIGSAIADELRSTSRVEVLGVPDAYLPHGNADQILASLGLDAAGIAATAVEALSTLDA